jgi:hypothetical protein
MYKLITLSEEKGFTSFLYNRDYLWMVDLQQWLREERNIIVVILPYKDKNDFICYKYLVYVFGEFKEEVNMIYDSYNKSLETALYETLLKY